MKRDLNWIIFITISYSFLLGGCSLGARSTRDLSIYTTYPFNNTVIRLGESLPLDGLAISTSSRPVTRMIFYANAVVAGETSFLVRFTTPAGTGYSGSFDAWTPSEIGEYFVQSQAGTPPAISEAIRVCVLDFSIPVPSTDYFELPYGYEGPCPIPDRDAFATPGAIVMISLASPDHLVYRPNSVGSTCPWAESISFQVTVNDPPEDVALVVVDVSETGSPAGRYPGLTRADTVVLTPRSTTNPSIKIYEGTARGSLNGTYADYFGNGPGDVTWTAKAVGRDGSILLTDGPYTIPAEPCVAVPFSAPFPVTDTPTPAPTFTPTPASEADCHLGICSTPATNRRIQIEIVTPKPGKPGGGDEDGGGGSACQPPPGGCAANEYWSTATCSCQVFE